MTLNDFKQFPISPWLKKDDIDMSTTVTTEVQESLRTALILTINKTDFGHIDMPSFSILVIQERKLNYDRP